MKEFVFKICEEIINGINISKKNALELYDVQTSTDLDFFLMSARRLFDYFCDGKNDLCSIINAKSGHCSENCAYCSQSAHFDCDISAYSFLSADEIVAAAKEREKIGAKRFSIVTSGGSLHDSDLDNVCEAAIRIKKETSLEIDASLGFLSEEQIQFIMKAGIKRFHHNLETSENFFSKICTTHTYRERHEQIQLFKTMGAEVCSGGIIGMGESRVDRIDLAFALKELDVDSVPINILDPRPGTPLENEPPLFVDEILKTLAIFRFILPEKTIKLAGGRERNLGAFQEKALRSGINGMIIGGYLTTTGESAKNDRQMMLNSGYIFE